MTVEYEDGRVHAITLWGGNAEVDGIPFQSEIVYGITIRNNLRQLMEQLGDFDVVDPGPPLRHTWRKTPWLIEVVIDPDGEDEREGKILWITITNVAG